MNPDSPGGLAHPPGSTWTTLDLSHRERDRDLASLEKTHILDVDVSSLPVIQLLEPSPVDSKNALSIIMVFPEGLVLIKEPISQQRKCRDRIMPMEFIVLATHPIIRKWLDWLEACRRLSYCTSCETAS